MGPLARAGRYLLPLFVGLAACDAETESTSSEENDIVGGVDATSASLDAIGTLGSKGWSGDYEYFCTATLVAPKVVLSAKHCAADGPTSEPRIAHEDVYFAVGADSRKPKQVVKAREVILSPLAEGGMVEYGSDVAVFLLDAPVEGVTPLPYLKHHIDADQVGKKLTAVGFGIHDRQRNSGIRKAGAVTLQAVEGQPIHKLFPTKDEFLAHMTKHEGAEWVAGATSRLDKFYDLTLLPGHEAYLGMGENDAQPCSGDSGGPLLQKIDGKMTVVAVVSGSFKGRTYPCSTVGEAYATLGDKVQPVLASATGPCEGVPVEGRCEYGTTAVRCVAETEGPQKITKLDCADLDQVCGMVDGKAACIDAAPTDPQPSDPQPTDPQPEPEPT